MKTLTIKDLAATTELDRDAMVRVRGGVKMQQQSYGLSSMPTYTPTFDSSITAKQGLQQLQDVVNATANESAFLDGISAHNTTDQYGQNNILVHH
jgi:hypothetical protein